MHEVAPWSILALIERLHRPTSGARLADRLALLALLLLLVIAATNMQMTAMFLLTRANAALTTIAAQSIDRPPNDNWRDDAQVDRR